jgi:tetratricopeptide (TPR) repeat protein
MIAAILLSALAASSPLLAQTNTEDVAQLTRRVEQLEKKMQEISTFLEPLRGQQSIIANRRKALQSRQEKRLAQDRDKYAQEDLIEAEKLYSVVSQKGGTPEAADSFATLLKKYPDNDRVGCALLYIAQRAHGDERIKDLQECIDKYGDCIYGDGVEAGAFARYLLAKEYSSKGDTKQAAALAEEIKNKYSDAIDHGGNLLVDLLGVMK